MSVSRASNARARAQTTPFGRGSDLQTDNQLAAHNESSLLLVSSGCLGFLRDWLRWCACGGGGPYRGAWSGSGLSAEPAGGGGGGRAGCGDGPPVPPPAP